MSKTFDNISEAASTNYLFLKAQMTLSLAQEPPTPPPLYALSFPSQLLCLALWFVKRLAPEGSGLHKWASGPSWFGTDSGEDTATIARSENSPPRSRRASKSFCSHRGRALTEAETIESLAKAIRESLAKAVTQYVLDHQADVAQEERWRTSMQRKMDQNNRSFRELVMKANQESQRNQDQMKANQKQNLANQEMMKANQTELAKQLAAQDVKLLEVSQLHKAGLMAAQGAYFEATWEKMDQSFKDLRAEMGNGNGAFGYVNKSS